jgi:DNA repair protein RadD
MNDPIADAADKERSCMSLRPLRPHQERALEALRASLASGHRRPILQMPTGAGKTKSAAKVIRGGLARGKRIAFTVPALSLIDQTVAALEAEGIHAIGVMQGIHERTDREQPVQVCSIKTLTRRKRPDVDLVIVDEAHQMHKEIFRWMRDCPLIPFIGMSATPWSRGLGKYYDDLIIAATPTDLIRDGYLSPFTVYAPSNPDLSLVSTVAGDFKEDELSEAMDRPSITGDIVGEWLKRGEDRPTLAFCVDRKHAQHVHERFDEVGVPSEYMDGLTPREDREATFARFRAGATRVICNVGVLVAGVDLPMVSCLIDARPTKSPIRYVQVIGRGLRTAEGKRDLRILDHAGNALRLGLVTDIHRDRLDDGQESAAVRKQREQLEPRPKLCEACKAVVPILAKACPACGEPVRALTMVREIEGDLIELGSRKSGKIEVPQWERRRFFAELLGMAEERGYAPGWASHKFKERFGHWPNGYDRVAMSPSVSVRNWVRSRQIAFAKARERAAHG